MDFGGHELAGGFSVYNEKIFFLEEALSNSFSKIKQENTTSSSSYLSGGEMGTSPDKGSQEGFDLKLDLNAVNMKNWREIEKLEPFGFGNPKPIFLFESVKIEKIKKFGKNGSGEHLEITFSDFNLNRAKAVSFFSNSDSFQKKLSEGIAVNLLATFDLSRFRGREELRLRIEDIF